MSEMRDAGRPSIFISHPGQAEAFAMRAKQVFESRGYDTWVWGHDRPARGDLDLALFKTIEQCDYFAHICTKHSKRSPGQQTERLFAKVLRKRPFVLLVFKQKFLWVFKRDFIPVDVDDRAVYNEVSPKTFDEDCMRAAQRLLREPSLKPATEADEGVPIAVNLEATLDFGLSAVAHVKKEMGEAV